MHRRHGVYEYEVWAKKFQEWGNITIISLP
jgi:hypothetical protein